MVFGSSLRSRPSRGKNRCQQLARAVDRLEQCFAELLLFEMRFHGRDQSLPELIAAFLMHAFVADNRELLRARSHENQDGVAMGGLLHSELEEFLLRHWQRIAGDFAALDVNANLARAFRFRRRNRRSDAFVIESAEKFFRLAYCLPTRAGAAAAETSAAAAESAKATAGRSAATAHRCPSHRHTVRQNWNSPSRDAG